MVKNIQNGVIMFTKIKKRLLYFETDGKVIHDFTAARQKKAAKLRKAVNFCFYVQCVAAITCAVVGILLSEEVFGRVFSGVAALCVIVVAFFALGGRTGEKTASFLLDLVYAVTAFFIGEMSTYISGAMLLAAAIAALVSLLVGYLRDWLLAYPPLMLRAGRDYKLNKKPLPEKEKETVPPPPPPKSELMEVAEAFMEILK